MSAQPRLIFINLPGRDLDAAMWFFRALDFRVDEEFTDDACACMTRQRAGPT